MFKAFVVLGLIITGLMNDARAQESFSEAGEPGMHKMKIALGLAEDPAAKALDANLYLPVYQREALTIAFGHKSRKLDFKNSPLGTAFVAPDALEDREFSLSASYRQDETAIWGLSANYGSASDRPFTGADVSVLGITLSHRAKTSETTQWIWFLNYSNNRVILNNLPLPGFAATFHNPEKTTGGMWGFPFVMLWARPTPKTFASAFFLFPSATRLQAGYLIWGPLQINTKLEFNQQVYLRANRARWEERLFFQGARALLGLKAYLGAQTWFELEAGRGFRRSLFQGTSVFDRNPGNLDLPDENLVTAGFQLSF